jgi:hypothetical protein
MAFSQPSLEQLRGDKDIDQRADVYAARAAEDEDVSAVSAFQKGNNSRPSPRVPATANCGSGGQLNRTQPVHLNSPGYWALSASLSPLASRERATRVQNALSAPVVTPAALSARTPSERATPPPRAKAPAFQR